tara:strand:- start:884 stop:1270 length:387 start_codon:yes stop_codon:yes gene_type:complete
MSQTHIVTKDLAERAYLAMLSQKTASDVGFHGAYLSTGGLSLCNKEELGISKLSLVTNYTYNPANSKKLEVKIEGKLTRKWHLAVIEEEGSGIDTMALLLMGYMVNGLVFAFSKKQDRDDFLVGFKKN